MFLSQWNGTSMLFKVSMHKPEVRIMSDASGSGVQLIGMESGSRWHRVIIWSMNKPL